MKKIPYQTRLPQALKARGLEVELVPGWETRGNSSFNPRGSVNHHTAGARKGVRPSLALCVNGRPAPNPLAGPLCNVFLDRNGVAVVVAAGRANHAGSGGFKGLVGNSAVFGTEAESSGYGDDWTPAQLASYPKIVLAYHDLTGTSLDYNCNHSTWTPRKIDCAGLPDSWFRSEAKKLVEGDTDLTPHESKALFLLADQLLGPNWAEGKFGWDQLGGKTPVDALAEIRDVVNRELAAFFPNRVDGKAKDTNTGFSINADANSYKTLLELRELVAKLDTLFTK